MVIVVVVVVVVIVVVVLLLWFCCCGSAGVLRVLTAPNDLQLVFRIVLSGKAMSWTEFQTH